MIILKKELRQARAIHALTVSSSATEAAQLAGISRRTLYSYLREPKFVRELEKANTARIVHDIGTLEDMKKDAFFVLGELMKDDDPDIRLKAARSVLEAISRREALLMQVFKFRRYDDKNDPMGFFS